MTAIGVLRVCFSTFQRWPAIFGLLGVFLLSNSTAQEAGPVADPGGAAPARIAADAGAREDQVIQRRLNEIFANIEGLQGVQIQVQAGVVTLSGEVSSGPAREQAIEIAGQVEGVVTVEEDIKATRDVQRRLLPTWKKLARQFDSFLAYLPQLGVAVLLFGLFWLLAGWVVRWDGLYRRLAPNIFLRDVVRQVIRSLLVLAGAVLALEVVDAGALVGAVLGATGLAGFAVAFAFRDTFENYIASILLSIRQPFEPNDHVLIEGHEGRVIRLTARATILLTLDGNHVRIPNALVFKGILINYSHNPKRRFDFALGVGTDEDLVKVQKQVLDTMAAINGILADPSPQCWIERLGDSSVQLTVSAWVDQRHTDYAKARSESLRLVKQALDEAGITMPEPSYNLRLQEAGKPIPPATAPPRPHAVTHPQVAMDMSRDTHLDEQVASDRAEGGRDLLSANAPKE